MTDAFSRSNRGWLAGAAMVFAATALIFPLPGTNMTFQWILTLAAGAWVYLSGIGYRMREERLSRFRIADYITISRPVLIAMGAGIGLNLIRGDVNGFHWAVLSGALVFGGFLTDLADGIAARLARKKDHAAARFGAWFDSETDAFSFMLMSFALAWTGLYPPWITLLGLARYAFGSLFALVPFAPRFPAWFSWTAKIIAAATEVFFSLAWAIALGLLNAGEVFIIAYTIVTAGLLGASFGLETVLRVRALLRALGRGPKSGILKSYIIYHGIPGRQKRMRQMYGNFVGKDSLVFDVGAHLGNRVRAFLSLEARVIAFEPQKRCINLLENWFAGAPELTLIRAGLGPEEGSMDLHVSARNPTLASFSDTWVKDMTSVESFKGIEWDQTERVDVYTLDAMIARYGQPEFIKIDVEGYESEVLKGLSTPVPALSFEFLPASVSGAESCIEILLKLGNYEFNVSMVETMQFVFPTWVEAQEVLYLLKSMPRLGPSGDVYARRIH